MSKKKISNTPALPENKGLQQAKAEIAFNASRISKCYRIYSHPRDRLFQALRDRLPGGEPKRLYREFWALEELSLQLKKGQTLGIIGRNGSGKSTLLQLICGILAPTTGTIQVHGRIGALLELGSGFNPDFSGLENVFLNASLLGLSKQETMSRLEDILGFADIGDFIHQPVKTYSSGMAVRLAFAVQAHIEPDLLVVDEALAVGDELFQKKCYTHLERLKEKGTSVILVTHSCPQIIQHCDQALLLHRGKARMLGKPSKVTVTYQRLINASDSEWDSLSDYNQQGQKTSYTAGQSTISDKEEQQERGSHEQITHQSAPSYSNKTTAHEHTTWEDENLVPQSTELYPAKGARIRDAWIETKEGEKANVFPFGQEFAIVFCYESEIEVRDVAFACHIASHTGLRITGQTTPESLTSSQEANLFHIAANRRWQIRYRFNGGLWPGTYFIGGGILQPANEETTFIHRVLDYRAMRIYEDRCMTIAGVASLRSGHPEILGLENT